MRRPTAVCLLIFALASLATATALSMAAPFGWPFELFVHFKIQYAVAAVALALGLYSVQRRSAAALAVGLAAFNALPVLHRAQAGAPPSDCRGPAFTVITANLQVGNDDRRFIRWLEQHPADLVVLQEVTASWAGDLAGLSGYPHQILLAREDAYGIGVVSRWPLDSVTPRDFAADGLPSLAGRVRVDGEPLQLVGLHTRWPISPALANARDRSLRTVAQALHAGHGATLVAGDLNATPYSPVFDAFLRAAGLRDAFDGASWRPTWMAGFWPLALGIDHVLVSPGLCVEQAEIGPSIGSDHRPVIARLRFAAN